MATRLNPRWLMSVLLISSLLLHAVHGQDIRLAGGTSASTGRLEVKFDGKWGGVCTTSLFTHGNFNFGNAVCRQLNFRPASSVRPIQLGDPLFPVDALPTYLQDPECNGHETNLFQCLILRPLGTATDCDKFSSIAIACNGTQPMLSLAGGPSPTVGRVERSVGSTTGYACAAFFYMPEAKVACRQLGFRSAMRVLDSGSYGNGTGKPHYSRLLCRGDETSLDDCASNSVLAEQFCPDDGPAAAIECSDDPGSTGASVSPSTNTVTMTTHTGSGSDEVASSSSKSWGSDSRSIALIVILVVLFALLAVAVVFLIIQHRRKS
ncbi:scavenger receptor cysteine-rich domain-containing group B protein-like isoform X2 [Sycon ciliatum]|uniref:scavenger receptor cysteine-rich domain-containing group B protein-like isoform X2 n=1 Tax=Sycon ciliatum TaxID=27933 RepID=UPI0020AD186A|eukprot:scpid68233/ scgid32663/ Neurotrypsin; Serine protease 12